MLKPVILENSTLAKYLDLADETDKLEFFDSINRWYEYPDNDIQPYDEFTDTMISKEDKEELMELVDIAFDDDGKKRMLKILNG